MTDTPSGTACSVDVVVVELVVEAGGAVEEVVVGASVDLVGVDAEVVVGSSAALEQAASSNTNDTIGRYRSMSITGDWPLMPEASRPVPAVLSR